MIEADGYTSESDASAYLEATYGYDADDACNDASQFHARKIEKGCPRRFATPCVTPRVNTRCLCCDE
jgi:hypothetical protein